MALGQALGLALTAGCGEPSGTVSEAAPQHQRATVESLEGCGAPYVAIPAIQGTGKSTPLGGQRVTTEGVVVGDFQDGSRLHGFFIQDPTGDGDAASSDGIFVFSGGQSSDGQPPAEAASTWVSGAGLLSAVVEGDRVRVVGTATEYYGQTELSRIESVHVCGRGTVAATLVEEPLDGDLERYEGMLVRFARPLTIVDSYDLGRFGELLLSDNGRAYVGVSGEPAGVVLDDGSYRTEPRPVPYLSQDAPLRLGDRVVSLQGIVAVAYGRYRVQPTAPVRVETANPRPRAPPAPEPDTLRVAAFNVQNYFVTLGSRGASTASELEAQRRRLVWALAGLDADIVGLVEVESDGGRAVADLVGALNVHLPVPAYARVPTSRLGSDAIGVALIYKPDRVTPRGAPLPSFAQAHTRPPLAQTFRWGTDQLTVVLSHFKSRRCSGARGDDLDQGDGLGCFNARRTEEALRLVEFSRQAQLRAGDTALLVMGDLNAYPHEPPLALLEQAGLSSLLASVDAGRPYSYVFRGRAGLLDHALGTAAVQARVQAAGVWHINADEPAVLSELAEGELGGGEPSLEGPFRSADHDPVFVDLAPSRRCAP